MHYELVLALRTGRMYTWSRVRPHCCTYVTKPRCTMMRFTGLLVIFLTLPFLIASHTPEEADPERKDTKEETFCPSATVQIGTGSGYVYRTSNTGAVGACRYWSVGFNAPVGGPEPTYFYVYEVRQNGDLRPLSVAVCGYQGTCPIYYGSYSGTVASTSSIRVVGVRQAGGIGGGVAELDTVSW